MIHGTTTTGSISAFQEMEMATTIPNVLRALGNEHISGFTKEELIEKFIKAGYNPEKAKRRYLQVVASKEIIPTEGDSNGFITIYSHVHMKLYPELKDVHIRAVKVERDGSIVYLT